VTSGARVVQFFSAVLAAYGASYGMRVNNVVFILGLALTLLLTIAIFQHKRNVLGSPDRQSAVVSRAHP
jgi:amino acid transporter